MHRFGESDHGHECGPKTGSGSESDYAFDDVAGRALGRGDCSSHHSQASRGPAVDKGKGIYIPSPKKKSAPPTKPKWITIGALVVSTTLIPKHEEPALRENDIITLSVKVHVGKLTEEEQLALLSQVLWTRLWNNNLPG